MERIPILRMGNFLLITIQVDMHDKLAMQLQDDVTARIADWGSIGVLIDISSLEIVDSFIGRMLANMAAMSRLARRRLSLACNRRSPSRWLNWACHCLGFAQL